MSKFSLSCICVLFVTLAAAQENGAKAVLEAQAAAWNRGDLVAFVDTYENSPETSFLGKNLTKGRDGVLARYRKTYDTPEKMGKLKFDIFEARMLGPEYALILGHFHLTRTTAGGGDASGNFSLVLHKGKGGWKIIHDHTS